MPDTNEQAPFSPGTWSKRRTNGDSNYAFEVVATDAKGKASTVCRPSGKFREGNGNLIAASPELLTAVRAFADPDVHLRHMGDKDGRVYLSVTREQYDAAVNAVAKAEGRQS